jgi:hypothetical protein
LIAGVLVNPTNLNLLEGDSAAYEVVLSRQPSSDVTISISFDTEQVSLDRTSLTFTPDNWNIPQSVTVTAVDDGEGGEGAHITIISQDANSEDVSYDTVDVADVLVNIFETTNAITLDSFTATATTGGIEVKWVTSAEIDTWGFHLLRSADGTRASAERVTSEMILAEGRGQGGATYTWLDTSADPDTTYTYWLEETEIDGTTLEYGPSSWAPANPTNTHTVYVPFI